MPTMLTPEARQAAAYVIADRLPMDRPPTRTTVRAAVRDWSALPGNEAVTARDREALSYLTIEWLRAQRCASVEITLMPEAHYRTARKEWQCSCDGACGPAEMRAERCPSVLCTSIIEPGVRYVEYVGEAPAYGSGQRYCLTCGIRTWNKPLWDHIAARRRHGAS